MAGRLGDNWGHKVPGSNPGSPTHQLWSGAGVHLVAVVADRVHRSALAL